MSDTMMLREALSAPELIGAMVRDNDAALTRLAADLRRAPPSVVVTCARGSSDHAATYGKYLIESLCGVPVASAAPSVFSIYDSDPVARGALMIAVSQSGRSPDLLATVDRYATAGARIVAIVNDADSPLAHRAQTVLPLDMGAERAVAATKSCLASMVMLAALTAHWSGARELEAAIDRLPGDLESALRADWTAPLDRLKDIDSMLVLGRGYSLATAQEAALKLKEICAIQAEPFSSAEVRHGPQRIIRPGFPLLGFAQADAAGQDVAAAMDEFRARGAHGWVAGEGWDLPLPRMHPAVQPVAMLAAFYVMADRLAALRGMNPDAPPHLSKVTETL